MPSRSAVLGGLTCRVVDYFPDDRQPELVVVLCHGFGAPGTDLVNLGNATCRLQPELAGRVRFIFPAAPLAPPELMGGRAWWPLDVELLMTSIARGEFRNLRNDLPEGLPLARRMLMDLIAETQAATGLPLDRFVLGGFSQGSMLATEVTLRLPETPALLCILSGTLLCESVWRELAPQRAGLQVLQSHGRQDPILPFEAAVWLRDMLRESGADVEFLGFDGIHTIPYEVLQRFAERLRRLIRLGT
jgi:phospholipase/carboxylesterase